MRLSPHAVATAAVSLPAFAVLASGAAESPSATAAPVADVAATANVQIVDFRFRPPYTRVEPGDSVVWTQAGSLHTVTSRSGAPEPFDSGDLTPGQQFTRAFAAPGRYPYHCTIHPEMRGVVQVGPDTRAPALTKIRVVPGRKLARVAFSLSETAKVTLRVAAKSKPERILRRSTARTLDEGRRSLPIAFRDLGPGRYRLSLRAVDRERNSKVVAAGSWSISMP